ncbi:MAG: hypothetical protein ACRDYX_22350 [Egibacteraceae bacterium]
MSTEHLDGRVAGERVADLVRMLTQIQMDQPASDGSYRFHFDVKNEVWAPFLRALMRIEAELLLHDADLVNASQPEPRTPDQRRADALVALALRVQDAVQD